MTERGGRQRGDKHLSPGPKPGAQVVTPEMRLRRRRAVATDFVGVSPEFRPTSRRSNAEEGRTVRGAGQTKLGQFTERAEALEGRLLVHRGTGWGLRGMEHQRNHHSAGSMPQLSLDCSAGEVNNGIADKRFTPIALGRRPAIRHHALCRVVARAQRHVLQRVNGNVSGPPWCRSTLRAPSIDARYTSCAVARQSKTNPTPP